jgi:hypothetical protein
MPLFLDIFANITIFLRKRKILPPIFSFFREEILFHIQQQLYTHCSHFSDILLPNGGYAFLHTLLLVSPHQADARGGAQGGRNRRQYRDGEVDDFLPEFFFHDV